MQDVQYTVQTLENRSVTVVTVSHDQTSAICFVTKNFCVRVRTTKAEIIAIHIANSVVMYE